MSISKKLRLAYVAEWLLYVSASAAPVEHSPVEEADGSMVVVLGKREENSESLNWVVNEAVGLDRDIKAQNGGNGDGGADSDGDSESEGGDSDSSDGSLVVGGSGGGVQRDNSTLGSGPPGQADSLPARLGGQRGLSTVAKNLIIAGGAIAAFIFVAAIAFWLYKTRGRIFRRARSKFWKRGGASRPRGGDMVHGEKPSVYPQSTIFCGGSSTQPGMERGCSIPGMPFPPPATLAPSDKSLRHHQSRKHLLIRTSHLLPEKRPVSSPSPTNEKGTFYDGASDVDSPSPSSDRGQEEPSLPPPVYTADRPLLSPSQSSSISNIKPRKPPTTPTNSRQPSYAQMYPPPPIPESNTTPRNAPQMDSRFSWTTAATSEVPSGVKSVRSSLDSEPRFLGVNSWVSHQVGRLERGERVAQLQPEQQQRVRDSSSSETPGAFSHHPGAPVSFLVHRARVESAELDGRLSGRGR